MLHKTGSYTPVLFLTCTDRCKQAESEIVPDLFLIIPLVLL